MLFVSRGSISIDSGNLVDFDGEKLDVGDNPGDGLGPI